MNLLIVIYLLQVQYQVEKILKNMLNMYEYYCYFNEILQISEKIFSVALSIVTIIGIIIGLLTANNYINKIRKRQDDSLFNFCAQLKIYLEELKNKLTATADKNILLFKFQEDSLKDKNNITIPTKKEKQLFKKFIKSFISFIKTTNNQMPISMIFHENYKKLVEILFELMDFGRITPWGSYDLNNGNDIIKKEKEKINTIIDTLLKQIDNKQKKIIIETEDRMNP